MHLYALSPTVANGDNGAWSTNKAANYLGCFDVTVDKAFTDGAAGAGLPCVGTSLLVFPSSGTKIIYGLVEARGAYTPISAEVLTVTLEEERN